MWCTDRWTAAGRPERAACRFPAMPSRLPGRRLLMERLAEQPGGMVQEAKPAV